MLSAVSGATAPRRRPTSPPHGLTLCPHGPHPPTLQFFYSGVPWESEAREYVAQTLNAATGSSKTRADVIAVSAMEGVGVAEALLKYHALSSTQYHIPYTNVRTIANWLHQPITQVGTWLPGCSIIGGLAAAAVESPYPTCLSVPVLPILSTATATADTLYCYCYCCHSLLQCAAACLLPSLGALPLPACMWTTCCTAWCTSCFTDCTAW